MPTSTRPRRRQRRPRDLGYLLTPNQITDLVMVPHMALEKLKLGLFRSADWQDYGVFANAVQLLAQEAQRQDVVNHGTRAVQVLISMRARAQRLGKWGCNGTELIALRETINPMDEFLRTRTTTQVKRALLRLDQARVEMTEKNVDYLEYPR